MRQGGRIFVFILAIMIAGFFCRQKAMASQSILISEVQIYPTESRFIELYNPSDSAVDLSGWYLQRKTQTGANFGSLVSKTYFEGKTIGAKSYFLISRGSLENSDIIYSGLTLTEANTIQLKNSAGDIVDKVGWGEASDCEGACVLLPVENQSLQRKFQNNIFVDSNNNADDYEILNCPSPKLLSKDCQTGTTAQTTENPSGSINQDDEMASSTDALNNPPASAKATAGEPNPPLQGRTNSFGDVVINELVWLQNH